MQKKKCLLPNIVIEFAVDIGIIIWPVLGPM